MIVPVGGGEDMLILNVFCGILEIDIIKKNGGEI